MIEFKGALSEEVRQSEMRSQGAAARIKFIVGTVVSAVLLGLVVALKYLASETKPTFTELFSGRVTLFLLLLLVVFTVVIIVSC